MARTKKKEIWAKVGTYDWKFIERVADEETAQARIRTYMRQDAYEASIGYVFPYGMPQYEIR